MTSPFRCAAGSLARKEAQFGTASQVVRWLLVEQPGPWGPTGFPESRLDPEVRASLQAQARSLGARPLLIRRHGSGSDADVAERSVFVVDSAPGRERVLHRTVRTTDELRPVRLDRGWRQVPGPLYLVCTHGRHDTCCAMRGRPVAGALAALDPERTWECSHLGGDRFASNTVVLPHGLYYGRLDAESAPRMAAATREGLVLPEFLRGRSSLAMPAQAAQHFAYTETGRTGFTDCVPVAMEQVEPETWRVRLRDDHPGGGDAELAVTVRRTHAGTPEQLTCAAAALAVAPVWDLVAVEVPARAA